MFLRNESICPFGRWNSAIRLLKVVACNHIASRERIDDSRTNSNLISFNGSRGTPLRLSFMSPRTLWSALNLHSFARPRQRRDKASRDVKQAFVKCVHKEMLECNAIYVMRRTVTMTLMISFQIFIKLLARSRIKVTLRSEKAHLCIDFIITS